MPAPAPFAACRIAFMVACKILMRSISSASTLPMPTNRAVRMISSYTFSRLDGDSFFESSTHSMRESDGITTQAAVTQPASGPRPTSSIPASRMPCRQNGRSHERSCSSRSSRLSRVIAELPGLYGRFFLRETRQALP
ncbi:hypothetical protein SDC9_200956 [bioreactor metagenome]|uniref:Uncharacterized protein n=1 Tax=bioreactor metagenome TaxID=1076179 RepID=A0A645IQX4_9ZZZZ